jgi:beta-N-acetylhexosaminidase
MKRVLAAALAAGAVAALAALAAPVSRSTPADVGPVGEVVMGTLTSPPTPAFLARVRAGQMGGVLLLGHWRSATVIASTTSALQRAACVAGEPLLIAADQEGGAVRRLPWAAPTVAPARITTTEEAGSQAASAAAALARVGINVDLAPVADTPSSPRSFLGTRAFSSSPSVASRKTVAFVDGLQQNGIAATAKHFPGLGYAGANTDFSTVVVRAGLAALRRGLLPFQSAIDDGVQLVMVSNASYPALDPSGRPAVFSPRIVSGILRAQLGFTGVIVSDTLTAPAALRTPHAATRAIDAGVDLLLFGGESASEEAYATLAADAAGSAGLRARLAASAQRIEALKQWLAFAGNDPTCD